MRLSEIFDFCGMVVEAEPSALSIREAASVLNLRLKSVKGTLSEANFAGVLEYFDSKIKEAEELLETTFSELIAKENSVANLEDILYQLTPSYRRNLPLEKIFYGLLLGRIEEIINDTRTLTELLDLNDARDYEEAEVDGFVYNRASKLCATLGRRATFPCLMLVVKRLQDYDELLAEGVVERMNELVEEKDNYTELAQWHGYADSKWRDKIEERMAELNCEIGNLSDEKFDYRLSITPLGCKARDLLEQGLERA